MVVIPKDKLRALIRDYNLKDAKDIQKMLKKLFGNTLKEIFEAELDHELRYSKYDYKNKSIQNFRNGYFSKTVKSNHDKIEISVPRNRKGEFEPQVVKKNQSDISYIEDQVLSMYANGMTTCDIEKHLENLYTINASAELI